MNVIVSFILVYTLTIVSTLHGAASVWKVESDDACIYLGGTIHLLRSADFPLPHAYEQAYQNSTDIIFETDLAQLQTPAMQQRIASKMMLPPGTTLEDLLSPEVYTALADYSEKVGIPLTGLNSFRPGMVMLILTQIELQKLGVTAEGVDFVFYQRGKKDQKTFHYFETPEEQIDYIASIGQDNPDQLVLKSIEDVKTFQDQFDDLVEAWRQGDLTGLSSLVEPMKKNFPDVYRNLLVKRNNLWMEKIKDLLENAPSSCTFILVGTAHFIGEDGILQQLQELGYRVEPLVLKPIVEQE